MNRSQQGIAFGGIALVAALVVGMVRHESLYETTDDAQVETDMVTLSAEVGGRVAVVRVHENDRVRRGDVLFELDDASLRARLAEAEAELVEATAEVTRTALEVQLAEATTSGNHLALRAGVDDARYAATATSADVSAADATLARVTGDLALATTRQARTAALSRSGALPETALEDANLELRHAETARTEAESARNAIVSRAVAARARVDVARGRAMENGSPEVRKGIVRALHEVSMARKLVAAAAVESVRAGIAQTKIVAPTDGTVSGIVAFAGATASTGQPLAQLVPDTLYIVANFKETQLARMPVAIAVDALPDRELEGRIETFAPATGARFAALRPDNASGNFVRVVQRVPVRIALVDARATGLKAGFSTEVRVRSR